MYNNLTFAICTLYSSGIFGVSGYVFDKYFTKKYLDFYIKDIPKKEKLLYNLNFVSFLHALFISIEGIACILNEKRNPRTFLPVISGYFLLDTVVQNDYKSITTFHHVCGFVISYFMSISKELYIFKLLPYFMISEVSTTFLCLGYMLKGTRDYPIEYENPQIENKIKLLKNVIFNVFSLSFFVTRIIIFPYKVFKIYRDHRHELKEMGGLASEGSIFFLLFLQFFWYKKIFKIVLDNARKILSQYK